ncbi:tetratricopeptide (TPR) repeat protein [Microbacterium sp. ZKA21]|uniref:tetratricopeptide repeat protein n=1 Tax=Microbacterium sp. ZKA21 TaxID=3381694 RepID=UPI003D1BADE9
MSHPRTLDEFALALADLRARDGAPSYADLARRVGVVRGGAEPAKITVYDCFRPGRRRLDPDLVHDIVLALGGSPGAAAEWREQAGALNGVRATSHVPVSIAVRGQAGFRIGREELLDRLAEDTVDVVVLSGLGGMGKTTIASALAGGRSTITVELRESERDRGPADPVEVIRRILGALGSRSVPYDLARLRDRLAREAAGRLIVIEDAASPAHLAALIVPGVRYIVTSRIDLSALDDNPAVSDVRIRHVAVRPLDDAGALRLLAHLITRDAASDGHPAPDAGALRRIVAVSGGLPLDLAMLAGVVREHSGWTFDDLASRFENEPRASRIRPVLQAATGALSDEDAEFIADAALLDPQVDVALFRAVHPRTDAVIRRVASRHLLDLHDGAVQMHDSVFAFVREQSVALRPVSSRRVRVSSIADALLEQLAVDEDAPARRVATVLAVAEAAREHGLDAVCERLAVIAHPALTRWALWSESLRLHDLAAQGRELTDIPELALGIAHSAEKLGRYDDALSILHRVRRVARGSALARTWNQIGNVHRWTSRFPDALEAYRTAIEIARQQHDRSVEGRALGNHADTLRILARYIEAEQEYAAALELARAAGDDLNIGIIRSNRALLWTSTGAFDAAEDELRELGADDGERALPHLRMTLALLAEARGQHDRARTLVDHALSVVETKGEYGPAADVLLLRARLDARDGRASAAIRAARDVFEDAQRNGSPLIATEAANSSAEIHLHVADGLSAPQRRAAAVEMAERWATEAIGMAELTGDRAEVARGRTMLADAARLRGDDETARLRREDAQDLYAAIGHRLAGARRP